MNIKRKAIVFIAVLAALFGCASKPAASPDEVSLNTAIRDAAARMENRLDRGTKVALINFTSPSQSFSEYVLDELSSVLVNSGQLVVVDRANLDRIRQEHGFNMSGEVSDASMQAIGQMLGAQALVTGSLTSLGDLRRIMFKTIMTETAAVVVQHPADIINDRRVQALLAQGGGSTGVAYGGLSANGGQSNSGRQGGSGGAAPAAAPVGPKVGTYTFFPRPRATYNAIHINVYLDKIVVRGRNMLLYVSNTPRGPNDASPQGFNTAAGFDCLITNLDRPSQSWKQIGAQYVDGQGVIVSYENVTATRFSIENKYWNGDVVWEEIKLEDAEYEP